MPETAMQRETCVANRTTSSPPSWIGQHVRSLPWPLRFESAGRCRDPSFEKSSKVSQCLPDHRRLRLGRSLGHRNKTRANSSE